MKADELLTQAGAVIRDRRRTYGEPVDLCEAVAKRWSLLFGIEITAAQVVLALLDVKLARLSQQPRHADSVIDLVGYSALLWEITRDG